MRAMLMPNLERVELDGPAASVGQRHEAVVTAFPNATEAGVEILRAGGNAIDAAVAAAWALCVCEPSASGLGGQTVLLVRFADDRIRIIDGHSRAPAAASLDTIKAGQQRRGYRSCTIPSTPATLDWAHRKYGVLSRETVMAPAIRIAEEGYPITPLQHRQARWVADDLRASPAGELFLQDGLPPEIGHMFRQPELAGTLRRLADFGTEDFYHGGIARQIAADMRAAGGLITEEDLASCGPPAQVEPVSTSYRGHRILSIPPPSGGLQLLFALNIIAQISATNSESSDDSWHEAIALASSAVFRERELRPLLPDDLIPQSRQGRLSEDYARQVADSILAPQSTKELATDSAEEPGDTTHLSVCDRDGIIVVLTQSIQSVFGAKVAHRDLGFLYNNYLCTCPRLSHPYELGPGCRPRSNMAPTLVLQGATGRPLLALGAAGSRRIISAILHVLSGVIDLGLDITDAVAAPRVHGLVGRKVWIERPAASNALLARLRARNRIPIVKSRLNFAMGSVNVLQLMTDGSAKGAADPRRDGLVEVLS
ncbi:gamma-glutamyltransferase family protein [Bradyrhizobium japonicum]|uniref:gamma-glutamyltransferase family protein n=1 Tax=Bradyrhizobium japonicum TaxID=375 RepID=UPI0027150C6B|nr:gamma-glutamyltransferase [Bradyrhizobium japonicum]WLB53564.1 gamma-glutamyltransferase [Bradyrhizobium japonicum]WLB64561.1 gamma-glutamyltransferase [Bradyrhizobium japonicum]